MEVLSTISGGYNLLGKNKKSKGILVLIHGKDHAIEVKKDVIVTV